MLNIDVLTKLRENVRDHEVDWTKVEPRTRRKHQELYKCMKDTIVIKIGLIHDLKARLDKYGEDVTECMAKLKKMGYPMIEEITERPIMPMPMSEGTPPPTEENVAPTSVEPPKEPPKEEPPRVPPRTDSVNKLF